MQKNSRINFRIISKSIIWILFLACMIVFLQKTERIVSCVLEIRESIYHTIYSRGLNGYSDILADENDSIFWDDFDNLVIAHAGGGIINGFIQIAGKP